jgi:hypothetical protein
MSSINYQATIIESEDARYQLECGLGGGKNAVRVSILQSRQEPMKAPGATNPLQVK